jgi:hypothetical protein
MSYLKPHTRALLIQDITEYRHLIAKPLNEVLEFFSFTGLDEEDLVQWIIAHVLERCHYVQVDGHHYYSDNRRRIYDELNVRLGGNLELITSSSIKCPKLWGDQPTVQIEMRRYAFYIWYPKAKMPEFWRLI